MTDPTARALAAHYFDQHIGIRDQEAGMPEWVTARARARYIEDVTANPEAVRQLAATYPHIATACVTCGHDQVEDLRWVGVDGCDALCRSLLACKRRLAAQEVTW